MPSAIVSTPAQMQPSRAKRFVLMLPVICAILITIPLVRRQGMSGLGGAIFAIFIGFPSVIATGVNLYLASYYYHKTSIIIWSLWSVAMLVVIVFGGLFLFPF